MGSTTRRRKALNPLSSIGTDLTVTLAAADRHRGGGFGGGGGGGGFGGGGGGGREVIQANQSAITDLSKLGKPGTHFDHDFLLPGTQLTFPQSQATQIASLAGVRAVSTGLVLSAVHQNGTVPKIVAKIKAGGDRLTVTGRVRFQFDAGRAGQDPRMHPEGSAAAARCRRAGRPTPRSGGGGSLGGGGGGRPGGGGFFNRGAFAKCLPAQVRNFRKTIVTPQQTIQQLVNPPQTNIKSSSVLDRRRRPVAARHRPRHAVARLERPLPLDRRRTRRSSPTATRARTA